MVHAPGRDSEPGEVSLADIVRLWSRWYVIRCVSDVYHAERRDDGAAFSTPDLDRLAREVAEDYAARPVLLS